MKPRKLTESEVTFTVALEHEHEQVEGNAIASGDAEYDAEVNASIIARLARGDISAWCCLQVTASWGGYSHTEYLGCCSFAETDGEKEYAEFAEEHGMRSEALDGLNFAIAQACAKLEPLLEVDRG